GMGGAFAATASDPSAIYFNPAGLAFQDGFNVLAGINFIQPYSSYAPEPNLDMRNYPSTSTRPQIFTPFNIYGSYKINDKIAVGLGIYNPFGLGTEWPTQWGQLVNGGIYAGSFLAVNSSIATYYFNPTISYKINDNLAIGVGVSYVYGTVDMTKTIPWAIFNPALSAAPDGTNELKGTGNGFNANFGIIYKPINKLSLGLSYRIKTNIDFSGNATYTNVPSALAQGLVNGTGKATLPMPANFYFGAAYQVAPDLRIEGNFQFVQWTAYKQLQINMTPVTPLQGTTTYLKAWTDEPILRIGAEYTINDKWMIRGGAVEDFTPQPQTFTEPMLPDGNRTDLTIGGSYKITDKLHVDAAYMIVLFAAKISPFENLNPTDGATMTIPGTYSSNANVLSVNFGYNF
ncbi:MAG: outer membrane protein transport protein, partial [Bacteroidota bacterium]